MRVFLFLIFIIAFLVSPAPAAWKELSIDLSQPTCCRYQTDPQLPNFGECLEWDDTYEYGTDGMLQMQRVGSGLIVGHYMCDGSGPVDFVQCCSTCVPSTDDLGYTCLGRWYVRYCDEEISDTVACRLCNTGTFYTCKTPPGSSYWCGCETPQFWCGRPCDSPDFNPKTCECPGAGGGPCQPQSFSFTPQINCDNLTLIFEVSGSVTVNYVEVYKLNPSDLQWNLLTTITDVFAPIDISKWSDGSYKFNVFLVDSCGEDREFEFNEEITCRPCPFQ